MKFEDINSADRATLEKRMEQLSRYDKLAFPQSEEHFLIAARLDTWLPESTEE